MLPVVVLLALTAAQSAVPSFDAATIKPSASIKRPPTMTSDPGRLVYTNASLRDCLAAAYGVKPYQVTGPSSLEESTFDIVATTAEAATEDRKMLMLQRLLSDRFHVRFHRESRDLPVYAIELGKNKPKLHESALTTPNLGYESGAFTFNGVTISDFAARLGTLRIDRPVLDRTGLTARYDIRLEFESDMGAVKRSMMAGTFASDLITAVQSQLGLKMESTKAPTEMLVVDQADKAPGEN